MSDGKTLAERRAEIEAKRAARDTVLDTAREEQEVLDLEAIDAIEVEKGIKLHTSKSSRNFVPGCPAIAGARAPSAAEYKRFVSQVNRANGNADAKVAALQMIGESCWVYPTEPASRKLMTEANSGLVQSLAVFVVKLAEMEMEAEGKG